MPTMEVNIQYGHSEKDSYTHKMRFNGGDNTNHLGGSGGIDMLTTDYDSIASLRTTNDYVFHYLKCLEQVAEPDIRVIAVYATQFSDIGDWGSSEIQFSNNVDILNFTPVTSNLGKLGPRGEPFIGGRQQIPATRRYGWLRWHYISGTYMDLPELFAPSEINATFDAHYTKLRNVGDQLQNYATLTSAVATTPQITLKALPSTVVHFGIRNG